MTDKASGSGGALLGAALNALHNVAVFNRRVEVLVGHLADVIPSGGRVLDLGCGDGSIALALMQRRPDLQIEGVDVLARPKTQIPVTLFDGHRCRSKTRASITSPLSTCCITPMLRSNWSEKQRELLVRVSLSRITGCKVSPQAPPCASWTMWATAAMGYACPTIT